MCPATQKGGPTEFEDDREQQKAGSGPDQENQVFMRLCLYNYRCASTTNTLRASKWFGAIPCTPVKCLVYGSAPVCCFEVYNWMSYFL